MAKIQSIARCAHLVLVALARIVDLAQRQQHLRGIVRIRIKLVVELEIPAARLRSSRTFTAQSPLWRTSFDSIQSAAFSMRGSLRGTPASPSA